MDGNNGFYYDSVYETQEQREEKKREQKRFFSRLFIALFAYMFASQVVGSLILVVLQLTMSPESYQSLVESNSIALILLSSASQYAIAFPITLLITKGMRTSEKTEKKKLSIGEGVVLLAVAELFMFVGNIIGTTLNTAIGFMLGEMPENSIDELVTNTPIWLIFIIVVILGPVVEEIIFRRIMIDRLSVYGDKVAIVFSAVAFGLMHGNLYQLFYATFLGILLGYVYTRTRDVKHTILLHAAINFIGSVLVLAISKLTGYVEGIYEDPSLVELTSTLINSLYISFQYGLIISGLISLIYLYKKREIKISKETEIYVPMRDLIKGGCVNVGTILFVAFSLILVVLNLF